MSDRKWRVGTKVPLNVYEGDTPVCQCHSSIEAQRIVDAMNAHTFTDEQLADLIRYERDDAYSRAQLVFDGWKAAQAERDALLVAAAINSAADAVMQNPADGGWRYDIPTFIRSLIPAVGENLLAEHDKQIVEALIAEFSTVVVTTGEGAIRMIRKVADAAREKGAEENDFRAVKSHDKENE